jgi:hypothetical protein
MKFWVIILTMPVVVYAQLDVALMLAANQPDWTDAIAFLENDERFDRVQYVYCGNQTPPLGIMQQFDVIYTGGTRYDDQILFGNRLADYVDGGGYVVSIYYTLYYWAGNYGIGGRWLEEEYAPYGTIEGEFYYDDYQDLNIIVPDHEIFQGVTHLSDVKWHIQLELRTGSNEIADFPDYPGVAINADETVVGLDYLCQNVHQWTGDGFLILANAACYLAAHSDVKETSWGWIKAEFE